jgi:PEP-CTERM putative exosortase interaction domain
VKFVKCALASAVLVAAANAHATPIAGSSLQTAINGLYRSPTCATCSLVSQAPNVTTDQAAPDETWAIEASGSSIATIVIELAGFADQNRFGIYDIYDPTQTVQLFGGPDSPGGSVLLSFDDTGMAYRNFAATGINFAGGHFGYYLQTPNDTFYSQAALNAGGTDQMVAFQGDGDMIKLPGKLPGIWGSSSYILAWEDLPFSSSDRDFDDFAVYVESVTRVPEPGTLALLGLGLLGIGFARPRRRT